MMLPDLARFAHDELDAAIYCIDKSGQPDQVVAHALLSIAASLMRLSQSPLPVMDGGHRDRDDTTNRNLAALANTINTLIARVDALEDDQPSERLSP